jgi:hypothetical protein
LIIALQQLLRTCPEMQTVFIQRVEFVYVLLVASIQGATKRVRVYICWMDPFVIVLRKVLIMLTATGAGALSNECAALLYSLIHPPGRCVFIEFPLLSLISAGSEDDSMSPRVSIEGEEVLHRLYCFANSLFCSMSVQSSTKLEEDFSGLAARSDMPVANAKRHVMKVLG